MERSIKIADKVVPIKFTMRSLKVYEEITGRSLLNENYLDIIQLSLGVEALIAFVFSSIHVQPGEKSPITVDEIELQMGLDYALFNEVAEAYTDFVPGLSAIKKRMKNDPGLVERLRAVGDDPEKLKAFFAELLENPNVQSREA